MSAKSHEPEFSAAQAFAALTLYPSPDHIHAVVSPSTKIFRLLTSTPHSDWSSFSDPLKSAIRQSILQWQPMVIHYLSTVTSDIHAYRTRSPSIKDKPLTVALHKDTANVLQMLHQRLFECGKQAGRVQDLIVECNSILGDVVLPLKGMLKEVGEVLEMWMALEVVYLGEGEEKVLKKVGPVKPLVDPEEVEHVCVAGEKPMEGFKRPPRPRKK